MTNTNSYNDDSTQLLTKDPKENISLKPNKPDKNKKNRKPASHTTTTLAAKADKHKLYEEAVQSPSSEVAFIDRVFKKIYGRIPTMFREDFCGTSISSCEWVTRRRGNVAIGVDLDKNVLKWGEKNNLAALNEEQRSRIQLICDDVLTVKTDPVQVQVAMNFSYMTFKTRDLLRSYYRKVHANLLAEGIFVCDIYGGTESQDIITEDRACDGYTYIWDQASYNPVTSETLCHIHFEFPDGSEIRKAYTYDWRLWSIAEVRELIAEAGFSNSTVYWEGTDQDSQEGNGVFRPTKCGEVCPGWIAYIVCEK